MPVAVKRIYEKPVKADGNRVLVDRLWPRGLTKDAAALHAWLRELAPSDALRTWFHSQPAGWVQFRRRYLKELRNPECLPALERLYALSTRKTRLTLLFASKNTEQNNATVLRGLITGMKKPPTGTGPAGAVAVRRRAVRRG